MSLMNQPPDPRAVAATRARVHSRRWLTVLSAMAAAIAAWAVAVQLFDVDLAVRQGSGSLQIGSLAVMLTSLVAGLTGWLLLALLERRTRRARVAWRVIASLVLLISLLGPLAATNGPAMAVLLGLHCLVGAILILGLPLDPARRGGSGPVAGRAPPKPESMTR